MLLITPFLEALISQPTLHNQDPGTSNILFHSSSFRLNGSGRVALLFLSPYVSTKFALEGFCDSQSREMNPFGIKTILLESAAIATPIWNNAKNQDISFVDKKYLKSLYSFRDKFIEGGNSGMDMELAALKIAAILNKKNPKSRVVIAKNKVGSKLLLLIPSIVLDKAVIKMYDMYYGDHH